jgi:hypothetical protein
MTSRRPSISKPITSAITHSKLVAAGIDILQDPTKRLGDLKATEVAHESSRTIGAFFYYWKTQEEYHAHLASHVLAQDFDTDFEPATESARRAYEEGNDGKRAWASEFLGSVTAHRMFLPRMAILHDLERAPIVDNVPAAHELFATYYARQQADISYSLKAGLGLEVQDTDAMIIALTAEDMAMRSMRNQLNIHVAETVIANQIPVVA